MKRNNRIKCIEIIRQVLELYSIHSINGQVTTCPYRGAVEMNKLRERMEIYKKNKQTNEN